jgi:integrase
MNLKAEAPYAYLSTVGSAVETTEYCRTFCKSEVLLMPRPRLTVPTYRKHSTGRAVVTVYREDGSRSEVLLPGKYASEQSKTEYERLLTRLRANDGNLPVEHHQDLTIAELVARFMSHAESYYVDPISRAQTSEIWALTAAFRPLVRIHGNELASRFGPLALQNLRNVMIVGTWRTDDERKKWLKKGRKVGLARTTCNDQTNRIKLLFRWAASMELIPVSVAHGLATIAGLRRGRSNARETEPVKPVAPEVIDATVPHLPPIVRDMIRILLLTGMRCGELCFMRACDLEMVDKIWLYRPERHKNHWRGRERVIAIGPRAQAIMGKYLGAKSDAYLFTPAEQDTIIRAERRVNRKTPLWPSHQARLLNNRKPKGKRRPGHRFDPGAINRAIRRACKRAGIERWHVHRLRHSASLEFSREMGLEAARAALGHASVDMSAMYAGHDLERAKEVAAKLG